jgi:hypothetical protein
MALPTWFVVVVVVVVVVIRHTTESKIRNIESDYKLLAPLALILKMYFH